MIPAQEEWLGAENMDFDKLCRSGSATYQLCGIGQVTLFAWIQFSYMKNTKHKKYNNSSLKDCYSHYRR